MKRIKRTQRQKARRNLLLLLPLCTLLLLLSSQYLILTPRQAIRWEECYAWTGETEIVTHFRTRYGSFYLSANENALLVTPFHRGLRTAPHPNGSANVGWCGWSEASACDLTRQEGPVLAHLFTAQLPGPEAPTVTQVYGRVDLEGACSILGRNSADPSLPSRSQTLLRGKDGHLYFWFLTEGAEGNPGPVYTDFTVLDKDGNELFQYHLDTLHTFLYV